MNIFKEIIIKNKEEKCPRCNNNLKYYEYISNGVEMIRLYCSYYGCVQISSNLGDPYKYMFCVLYFIFNDFSIFIDRAKDFSNYEIEINGNGFYITKVFDLNKIKQTKYPFLDEDYLRTLELFQ